MHLRLLASSCGCQCTCHIVTIFRIGTRASAFVLRLVQDEAPEINLQNGGGEIRARAIVSQLLLVPRAPVLFLQRVPCSNVCARLCCVREK